MATWIIFPTPNPPQWSPSLRSGFAGLRRKDPAPLHCLGNPTRKSWILTRDWSKGKPARNQGLHPQIQLLDTREIWMNLWLKCKSNNEPWDSLKKNATQAPCRKRPSKNHGNLHLQHYLKHRTKSIRCAVAENFVVILTYPNPLFFGCSPAWLI